MSDLATLMIAFTGASAPVGAGISWVYKEVKSIKKDLDACKDERAVNLIVIELLWQVVVNKDPNNPVLERAKKLLDNAQKKLDTERGIK